MIHKVPVNIPLDKICVKTGILCPRCQRIMDSGKYDEIDLEVMRALVSIEQRIDDSQLEYVKSYLFGNKLVVLVKTNRGELPRDLGKHIEAALDNPRIRSVIVIPTDEDPQRLVEYVIRPYKVIDMKRVYLPDGSETVTIIVPLDAAPKLSGEIADLVKKYLERKLSAEIFFEFIKKNSTEEKRHGLGLKKPDLKRILGEL